jgi:hypothetical protein
VGASLSTGKRPGHWPIRFRSETGGSQQQAPVSALSSLWETVGFFQL